MRFAAIFGAVCLLVGSATVFLITLGAFAGHPGPQFMWLFSKWKYFFGPDAIIYLFGAMFFASIVGVVSGFAVAVNVWIAGRKRRAAFR
jgi:uncharacterized membrane protein YdcZ (DUF606 family)